MSAIDSNDWDVSMSEEDQFNSDVRRLMVAANAALQELPQGSFSYGRLRDALEQLEPWFESNDPRDMGWVDDRGRP